MASNKVILFGQFYARFEFPNDLKPQRTHAFAFNGVGNFQATCWILLLESSMLLLNRSLHDGGDGDWWISSDAHVFGIIDIRRGYHMNATISRQSPSNDPSLQTMTIAWKSLDMSPYRLVLAPCDPGKAQSICRTWVNTFKQIRFGSGVHNWPIMIPNAQEVVHFSFGF